MTQENPNNNGTIQGERDKASPPYIPFMTFYNFITWIETEGIPIKFDRSFWVKKYAGSTGAQLTAGLRFLGLLKGEYTQPQLQEIVKAKGDDRKKLLADMIRNSYSAVEFTLLDRATPSMLKDWFDKYNLDGSTERKAESFFINACKAYNIPLSNALKKKARNKQPGFSRRKTTEGDRLSQDSEKPRLPPEEQDITDKGRDNPSSSVPGYMETIKLPGDIGTITISVSINPIKLKGTTREWFNQLIDKFGECPTE